MTKETKTSAALSYASKGWHIFPVTPNQKIPYGSLVSKGHLNATTSADQITEWWTEAPNANIGLNLEASGLVCIDVDSYKPDCGFDDFIKDKHLPQTLTQKSASGGTHYIFKANQGTATLAPYVKGSTSSITATFYCPPRVSMGGHMNGRMILSLLKPQIG